MPSGPLELALGIAEILDRLGIPYVVGGSLASSIVGEPRATADVDIAVRMQVGDVDRLITALGADYYVSGDAVRGAVARSSSFNIVHLETVQKVDLFVLGDRLLDRWQLERRRRVVVSQRPLRELWVGSNEDQVLRKLDWYRTGGGVSERQWRDVIGILTVQAGRIDRSALDRAAAELSLAELLSRAFAEAGLESG